MAPKKSRKVVQETMVEEPTQDPVFHPKPWGRKNKRIPKLSKTMIAMRTMKVKRSNQMRCSSPRNNWRSYSK
jgi:hypothetical protein